MKTLLNSVMGCLAGLALASCGGDPAPSAQASALHSSSSKASTAQQALASDYHNVVQKIYVGYFGRPADPGGLAYFSERFLALRAPTTIEAMDDAYMADAGIRAQIDVFGGSAESAALYPGDNGTFMEAVYRNLFARQADAAGKAYWVALLDAGKITRANAAVNLMAGAQGSDIVIVNNKTAVASYFTSALKSTLEQLAYNGLAANVGVRQMLAGVNATTNISTFQATVDAAIATLVANLSPQGLYSGTLAGSGLPYHSLILENGQYWGLYSSTAGERFAPAGLLQGSGNINAASFSSGDVRDFGPPVHNPGTLDATFVPQSKLDGTLNTPAGAVGFVSGSSAPLYDYNVAAQASDLQGGWTMADNDSRTFALTSSASQITATGAFCSFSGSMAPRASGINVFDTTLTYSAGACRMAGQTVSGVGFVWRQDQGSTEQLVIAAVNAERSGGTIMSATRVTPAGMAPALVITDTVAGSGAAAAAGNTVSVHYSGYLYNAGAANLRSTRFDSSVERGTPFEFTLGSGRVIAGWDQGLVGMKVGGKRTLVIPAALGYGTSGSGRIILPNAAMVFEIEMISIR